MSQLIFYFITFTYLYLTYIRDMIYSMKDSTNNNISLGEQIRHRIKELRKKQKLYQEQLATKADMEATFLSRIERGHTTNIQINTLEKIITALNVDYATFFSFTDSDRPLNQIVAKLSLLHNQDEALTLINNLLDWKLGNTPNKSNKIKFVYPLQISSLILTPILKFEDGIRSSHELAFRQETEMQSILDYSKPKVTVYQS